MDKKDRSWSNLPMARQMKLPLISNPELSPLPLVLQRATVEHPPEENAAFWDANEYPSTDQSLDMEDEAPANINILTQPWGSWHECNFHINKN